MQIPDSRGKTHSFPAAPRRVVSLVPSLTETLFDLGAGSALVARTTFCIFPSPEVLSLPTVGGTKNPDIDAIRALAPDLVYMNLEENLERHALAIESFAPVFVTEPKSVPDVLSLITTLGLIHRAGSEAKGRREEIAAELAAIKPARNFRFACAIWKDPWMWCGGDTYVSRLVEAAGGQNVAGERLRYPSIPVDEIVALDPDVIFLPDEPYAFSEIEAEPLRSQALIVGPFPGHLFTWHGTRTRLGLRFLRDLELGGNPHRSG